MKNLLTLKYYFLFAFTSIIAMSCEEDDPETVIPPVGTEGYFIVNEGDWGTPRNFSMAFILRDDIRFMGTFDQVGFGAIEQGVPVRMALNSDPGVRHDAVIEAIPPGVGEGQVNAQGQLQSATGQGITGAYVALITVPDTVPLQSLHHGQPK